VVDVISPEGQQIASGSSTLFPSGMLIVGIPFSLPGGLSERRLRGDAGAAHGPGARVTPRNLLTVPAEGGDLWH
jgi:hypothetical protein